MSRQKAYGQNFLHHKPTIDKIISTVTESIDPSAINLIEIGPGEGAITKPLIETSIENKIPLYIIEKDFRLKEGVESFIPKNEKIELMMTDATSDEFIKICKRIYHKNKKPICIVSNLPYSVSTSILSNICSLLLEGVELLACIVMVQKEVANRICAEAGDTENRGSFSLLMQTYFKTKKLFDVSPGAFTPAPKVMSTVLKCTPIQNRFIQNKEEAKNFEKFCKLLFSNRRKMIRKSLSSSLDPDQLKQVFQDCNLDGTERVETLELKTVYDLFMKIKT